MQLLGKILLSKELISEKQLESALSAQNTKNELLGNILVRLGYIDIRALLKSLAEQFDIPYLDSIEMSISSEELIKTVPLHFLKKNNILPYRFEAPKAAGQYQTSKQLPDFQNDLPLNSGSSCLKEGTFFVAVSDPLNTEPIDDLQSLTGCDVLQVLSPPDEIIKIIHNLMEESFVSPEEVIEDLSGDDIGTLSLDLEEAEDLLDLSDEAPIIRLVNKLFYQAIKGRASDIHIEPYESKLKIRFRIDGTLYEKLSPPKLYHGAIVSRIKIMAGLNIAEKRLPQDGRIRLKVAGKDVDIRLSVIPTSFGERLVLRILDRASILIGTEDLGMDKDHLKVFNRLIASSNGIILVTGPTGSGKTTTLYAALEELNLPERNILTVEDPVEYQVAGIGQIPVNTKIGLTFAVGLRSILRQDPDIVMVGEIRDLETAEIATQASLTGHLVFSTLHTNDAAGAVTRLVDMGMEAFLVSATLRGVIAQRLVRKICNNCKIEFMPSKKIFKELGLSDNEIDKYTFYKGTGCTICSETGYKGRTAIYEIMRISESMRRLIVESNNRTAIIDEAKRMGMTTMKEEGMKKVKQGITTLEEVIAVTQESD